MICPTCAAPLTGQAVGGMYLCPVCKGWVTATDLSGIRGVGVSDVVSIDQVEAATVDRIKVGGAWDDAFGGGIVKSQSTIVTGPPGSGKTTLLLQKASRFAEVTGLCSWLISAEQSSAEIKITVNRLKLPNPDRIIVLKTFGSGGELDDSLFKKFPPGMIILDSLTALCGDNERAGIAIGKTYKGYSIKYGVPTFVIMQVNKEGDLAGRMKSQHDLDTITSLWPAEPRDPKRFQYDGEYRKLEVFKNRFGPRKTDSQASWFNMTAEGFIDAPAEDPRKRRLDDDVDFDYVMAKGTLAETVSARQDIERQSKDAALDFREMIQALRGREAKLAAKEGSTPAKPKKTQVDVPAPLGPFREGVDRPAPPKKAKPKAAPDRILMPDGQELVRRPKPPAKKAAKKSVKTPAKTPARKKSVDKVKPPSRAKAVEGEAFKKKPRRDIGD